nr:hypothetical protein [Hydrogenophaga aromaticivorans]
MEHEQTRAIGMVLDVEDGLGGHARGLGLPVTLSRTPATPTTTKAPHVGEHSTQVLTEFGFSDAEINALVEAGVMSPATQVPTQVTTI